MGLMHDIHGRPSGPPAPRPAQIEVGDLIVINNREPVPCDVVIMGVDEPVSESPAGVAYVETKSLDGETNLKIRQVRLCPTTLAYFAALGAWCTSSLFTGGRVDYL